MKVFTLVVALAALACSATGADVGATSQHNGLGPFSRLYRPPSMPSPCTTVQGSCGESLHLSRLPPAVARKASRVEGIGSFPSYAGFFTVREDTDNNLFFWYFPAQSGKPDAPLLIWLQGGPGGSSLFGLFVEQGPLQVLANGTLVERALTWNKEYSMIFIDNPVGAGFSYTTQDAGYCTNETQVADQLYSFLTQWYAVFPEQKDAPLYVTGESYAGHYVPAFGYKIHQEISAGARINFAGVAIGDGWVDPIHMVPAYAAQMFNIGMADEVQRQRIQKYTDAIVSYIKQGNRLAAFTQWDEMLNGDVFPYPNYFHNITGSNDYDNFARTDAPADFSFYYSFLQQPSVRKAIHVGDHPYNSGHECEMHLLDDFMVSLAPQLSVLMDNYKVMLYSGQFDIIVGWPLTAGMLSVLEWTGAQAFKSAPRAVWRVAPTDKDVAGYVRQVGNFTQVIVRDAGHIVPADQPAAALDMITHFVDGVPFVNQVNPATGAGATHEL